MIIIKSISKKERQSYYVVDGNYYARSPRFYFDSKDNSDQQRARDDCIRWIKEKKTRRILQGLLTPARRRRLVKSWSLFAKELSLAERTPKKPKNVITSPQATIKDNQDACTLHFDD